MGSTKDRALDEDKPQATQKYTDIEIIRSKNKRNMRIK
jgi:hypothetical protein